VPPLPGVNSWTAGTRQHTSPERERRVPCLPPLACAWGWSVVDGTCVWPHNPGESETRFPVSCLSRPAAGPWLPQPTREKERTQEGITAPPVAAARHEHTKAGRRQGPPVSPDPIPLRSGAIDGVANGGKRGVGIGAQRRDGRDAHHDDEGQHDGVLDSRGTIFTPQEIDRPLPKRAHETCPFGNQAIRRPSWRRGGSMALRSPSCDGLSFENAEITRGATPLEQRGQALRAAGPAV